MYITTEDLPKIVNDYLVQNIVPKVPSDLMKFGLSFASSYISDNTINNLLSMYGGIITKIGIIEDGKIDINLLRDNALKAIKVCNHEKFNYMGYNVDADDIDVLYKIMTSYAKS